MRVSTPAELAIFIKSLSSIPHWISDEATSFLYSDYSVPFSLLTYAA